MKLETWAAPEGEAIPNHPRFAVLVYRGVADAMDGATACRALFGRHGWGGAWIDGVFDFHHFHSTSHEVLGVVRGAATLELGGPQDRAFDVEAGDVVVLPAGTGHRRATGRDGFQVVGAYPAGQEDYDLLRAADQAARDRIVALPPPPEDRSAATASPRGGALRRSQPVRSADRRASSPRGASRAMRASCRAQRCSRQATAADDRRAPASRGSCRGWRR